MTLRIRLLGGVEVDEDGDRLRVDSGRVESLLAYLLLHRDAPQSRQHLAYLLWPDTTDAQARTNLRHVLHTLRRTLRDAENFLDIAPRTLQWRAEAAWELDIAEFEAALAGAATSAADPARSIELLRLAVDLYRGELVAGCYDEWLVGAREEYRGRYLEALDQLVRLLEADDAVPQAISYAERLLAVDPLREETYRALIRLHAGRGDRARAIRTYHACSSMLERELGVPPSAATRQAYDSLLAADAAEAGDSGRELLGAAPFVGRARERAALTAAWRRAEAGRSALVLLTGEAGIGKTRLVEDFRAWCAHRGARTSLARSYAAEGALAYGPVATWLRSPAVHRDLTRLDHPQLIELARLLPELLIEIPGLARPEQLPESDQRQALFDAVVRALLQSGRPLLLVADDAHWCDRETLQLLHFLLRVAPGAKLLVVVTARTEDIESQAALPDLLRGVQALDRLTEIELGRLSRSDTAALAERLGGPAVAGMDDSRLWHETEGNPLFVVEAVRAGWPGAAGLTPKVQAVIESRLVQLSQPAQALLGMAATIGRDFTVELLTEATGWDEDTVVGHLDELWRRRLVREQGGSGHGGSGYDFSHDKIRAVAYAGVSPIRRRHYHLSIARTLERGSPSDSSTVSAQIAIHYDNAGAASDATTWYLLAARAAQQLQAGAEAIRLLERARDVLLTLPPSSDRDGRELAVLTALPGPLASVEGYASPRLSAAHDRAIELAGDTDGELAPPLLWSLAFSGLVREDFARSERYAGELRERGERESDDILIVQGCCLLGLAAFWQADLGSARRHFRLTIDHYHAEQLATHLLRYGQDPQVLALARMGNIEWFLGDPQAATRARDAALARADAIGHALTTGAALVFAALLALDMDDDRLVQDYSAQLAALAPEALPVRYFSQAIAGYVAVLTGETAAGLRRISSALDEVAANPPAPGMWAIVQRIQLAACVAAGDERSGTRAAERLLQTGGPARLWAAEARRRLDFFAIAANRNG